MLTFNKYTPFFISLIFCCSMMSCQKDSIRFVGKPLVMRDSTNELRMKIGFELNQKSDAYIAFWVKGTPSKKYYSELSKSANSHQIVLVGLKGQTTYEYQVEVKNDASNSTSNVQSFTTEKFPINILHLRWDQDQVTGLDGYILSQRRMVNGIIYLIDRDGDVVWYQNVPKQPKLSHWTAQNTILVLYGAAKHRNSSGDQIAEYDLYGKEIYHLDLSSLDEPLEAHHEVRYDNSGNLLTLVYQFKDFDLSGLGGSSSQRVMGDQIVKLDTLGKVLWSWSIFDHLNPSTDSTILKTAEDWSHANSLSLDKDGNYLISFRNFNQVWKIDSTTGDIIWKLGDGGTIELDKSGYIYGQHAFHLNSDGNYQVFDNGRKNRKTRVVTYQVNETNQSVNVLNALELPEELYCEKMGSAYLMKNNNLLLCAPRSNSLVVLNQEGEILAQGRVGIPDPYRAEYVPELYRIDHVE